LKYCDDYNINRYIRNQRHTQPTLTGRKAGGNSDRPLEMVAAPPNVALKNWSPLLASAGGPTTDGTLSIKR